MSPPFNSIEDQHQVSPTGKQVYEVMTFNSIEDQLKFLNDYSDYRVVLIFQLY